MNVLDENIPEHQRQLLSSWRIPVRQIGREVGHRGLQDPELNSAAAVRATSPTEDALE